MTYRQLIVFLAKLQPVGPTCKTLSSTSMLLDLSCGLALSLSLARNGLAEDDCDGPTEDDGGGLDSSTPGTVGLLLPLPLSLSRRHLSPLSLIHPHSHFPHFPLFDAADPGARIEPRRGNTPAMPPAEARAATPSEGAGRPLGDARAAADPGEWCALRRRIQGALATPLREGVRHRRFGGFLRQRFELWSQSAVDAQSAPAPSRHHRQRRRQAASDAVAGHPDFVTAFAQHRTTSLPRR
jgi:hypothetical protein